MNPFPYISRLFRMDRSMDRESPDSHVKSAATLANWLATYNEDSASGLADPYNLSPWVARAIKHIAGPISKVSLDLCEDTRDGEQEIEDPALTSFWSAPAKGPGRNGKLSRVDTIEATVGWLCLSGEFFWVLDDTWLPVRASFRSPFIIARPERMRPILDDGELIGWTYTDAANRRHPLISEQVVSSRFWNPTDDLRGAAPMDTARQAAESDYASGRFWKSLSESNGDRGETVIAPNGITAEQEAQVIRALRAKRAASKKGKFQPMFLVGDIKTEDPKIQAPDAAGVTQRLQNRHEVFIAFGVPPSFAEVTASYSIGSASDRYKLIEETCQPIAAKIAEAVETISSRLLPGRKVIASFCFDDHSTMQQVRAERIEAGRKLHERGVPWSVISDHLQLGLEPFPGWDRAWLPFNLTEVKPAAADTTPAPETPEPAADPLKAYDELAELLKGCPIHQPKTKAAPATPPAAWTRQMSVRAPHVKRMRAIIDKALFTARTEVLSKLSAAAAASNNQSSILNLQSKSGAFDFLFDIGNFLDILVEPLFRATAAAYVAAGEDCTANELPEGSGPFISADPNGIRWLQERKNYIRDASNEIWAATRDTLDEGLQAGESYSKLAARVRESFNGITKHRSLAIAMTETGIAFETGRHEAMVQAGVMWKVWMHSGAGEHPRDTHMAANGQIRAIDAPFNIGMVSMMYPCDPTAGPEEIIHCRCVHAPSQPPPDPSDIEGNNPDIGIPY